MIRQELQTSGIAHESLIYRVPLETMLPDFNNSEDYDSDKDLNDQNHTSMKKAKTRFALEAEQSERKSQDSLLNIQDSSQKNVSARNSNRENQSSSRSTMSTRLRKLKTGKTVEISQIDNNLSV